MNDFSATNWDPLREREAFEPRKRRRWPGCLFLLLGLVLGLALGLMVAWGLAPVQFHDTDPVDLHLAHKETWILHVAVAYQQDGNWERALDRLAWLEDPQIGQTVAALAKRYIQAGQPDARIRALAVLADALGTRTGEMSPYLGTPEPGSFFTPTPEPPTQVATLTPAPTDTSSPETPTSTPVATPTSPSTPVPIDTPTNTTAATPSLVPVDTPTNTPSATPSLVPVDTPTNTPSATPTGTPTVSPTPTDTPTGTPTPSPTLALVTPDTPTATSLAITSPVPITLSWPADLDVGVISADRVAAVQVEAKTSVRRYAPSQNEALVTLPGTTPLGLFSCTIAPLSTAQINTGDLPKSTFAYVRAAAGCYPRSQAKVPVNQDPAHSVCQIPAAFKSRR